jgi:hypothetical protein
MLFLALFDLMALILIVAILSVLKRVFLWRNTFNYNMSFRFCASGIWNCQLVTKVSKESTSRSRQQVPLTTVCHSTQYQNQPVTGAGREASVFYFSVVRIKFRLTSQYYGFYLVTSGKYSICFCFMTLGPGSPHLLIIEDSRSHSDTPHLVELRWTSDQPDAETSTWKHTTLTTDRHS